MKPDIVKMIDYCLTVCRAGGCEFAEEQLADYDKVKAGKMTMEEIDKKLMDEIERLRIMNPELFEME